MTALVGELVAEIYGEGTSTLVPGKYDVGLNGHVFMYDTRFAGQEVWDRKSVKLYKPQQDQSAVVSEASLNPEDLARVGQESWHKGAGQTYFDRPDSDKARFRSSKGIDVFTERWKFGLLPATDQKLVSSATNLQMAVAGDYLYVLDGTAIKATQDITVDSPTWTTLTGTPGTTWKSITSDGYYLYATDGANIYRWARAAADVGAAWNTADIDLLTYVRGKGRLMGAVNTGVTRSACNITGSGAPTDIKPSVISPDFTWIGFAESANVIYGAGYQGDKSLVFRWGIKVDGTGLDAAIPALPDGLPDGEILRSIFPYQGHVALGTDKGVWVCSPDSNGNLAINKVIDLEVPVRCFEGQGRFLRFGWTNYDGTSTGLGRMDLSIDTAGREVVTPAYSSDLMATAQGNVTSIVAFQGRTVFAVSGAGIWAEETTLVASGTLQTGLITYGLADPKIAVWLTISHEALDGSVQLGFAADGASSFAVIGTNTEVATLGKTLPVGEVSGQTFEIEFTLSRSSLDTTEGPTITRWGMEANPAPGRGQVWALPLRFYPTVTTRAGDEYLDVRAAEAALIDLEQSGRPIACQDAGGVTTVFLDDHDFILDHDGGDLYDGVFIAIVRRPRRRST